MAEGDRENVGGRWEEWRRRMNITAEEDKRMTEEDGENGGVGRKTPDED